MSLASELALWVGVDAGNAFLAPAIDRARTDISAIAREYFGPRVAASEEKRVQFAAPWLYLERRYRAGTIVITSGGVAVPFVHVPGAKKVRRAVESDLWTPGLYSISGFVGYDDADLSAGSPLRVLLLEVASYVFRGKDTEGIASERDSEGGVTYRAGLPADLEKKIKGVSWS